MNFLKSGTVVVMPYLTSFRIKFDKEDVHKESDLL
jgi:hypothetical protein